MTAAQPFSGSEEDAIRGKRQGKSKSDHLPRGQVAAHHVYHSGEAWAESETSLNVSWQRRATHPQVTVLVDPLLKSLGSRFRTSLYSQEGKTKAAAVNCATFCRRCGTVARKANTNKADTSRITVTLYAIERQTKSVLRSMVKQPPTALLLSHTETISHNDFSASCPGVCLS